MQHLPFSTFLCCLKGRSLNYVLSCSCFCCCYNKNNFGIVSRLLRINSEQIEVNLPELLRSTFGNLKYVCILLIYSCIYFIDYYTLTEEGTREECTRACLKQGRHLATITTQEDLDKFMAFWPSAGNKNVFGHLQFIRRVVKMYISLHFVVYNC